MQAEAVFQERIQNLFDGRASFVDLHGPVGTSLLPDFRNREPENEDVVGPDLFADLDVCASSVPIVSAPFMANFMLPVPEASVPAVETCSLNRQLGQ